MSEGKAEESWDQLPRGWKVPHDEPRPGQPEVKQLLLMGREGGVVHMVVNKHCKKTKNC